MVLPAQVGGRVGRCRGLNRRPGLVAFVMQDGKVVYEKAFGWADKEANATDIREVFPSLVYQALR